MKPLRQLVLLLFLCLALAGAAHATPITVDATQIENWRGPATNVYLYFYLSTAITTPDGQSYPASTPARGITEFKFLCTVSSATSGGVTRLTLNIPALTLPATRNALIGSEAVYQAIFYQVIGARVTQIGPWDGTSPFWLASAPTSTTWHTIRVDNQGGRPQPQDNLTFSRSETLSLLQQYALGTIAPGALGQLTGYTATGRSVGPITVGACLSLSGGVLTGTCGGGGGGGGYATIANQNTALTQRTTLNLGLPFLQATDSASPAQTNLELKRTPTGVYNALSDLNLSGDASHYKLTATPIIGATSVTLSGELWLSADYFPERINANSLNSWRVGQGIRLVGAGAAGIDLVTTITAVSGNTLSFSDAVATAGCNNVAHDETNVLNAFMATHPGTTIQFPAGGYSISSYANYTAGKDYALTLPNNNEALNQQMVLVGDGGWRARFVHSGPGHAIRFTDIGQFDTRIRGLGIEHISTNGLSVPNLADAGAALWLVSEKATVDGGFAVPHSNATNWLLDDLWLVGWKYAIASDNMQSSTLRDLSLYYNANGIVLLGSSDTRGSGVSTEPNANKIENPFIQYGQAYAGDERIATATGTATSRTISSPDAVFTSADLYKIIKLEGAQVSGSSYYGFITKINSSTSADLSLPLNRNVSGAVLTIYPTATANIFAQNASNLQITGGTSQGNWEAHAGKTYGILVRNSDQFSLINNWNEDHGGYQGAALGLYNVRGATIIGSNMSGQIPGAYGVGLLLDGVRGATIQGSYISSSGTGQHWVIQNGTCGVKVINSVLTGVAGGYNDSTNAGGDTNCPVEISAGTTVQYTAQDDSTGTEALYDCPGCKSELVNSGFREPVAFTGWTQSVPSALAITAGGAGQYDTYLTVDYRTGGAPATGGTVLTQTVAIADNAPKSAPLALGFDWKIVNRGTQAISGQPSYDWLRVKLAFSGGATYEYQIDPKATQGQATGRWVRQMIRGLAPAGSSRTVTVFLESATGTNAAVFAIANLKLYYGMRGDSAWESPLTAERGGRILTASTVKWLDNVGLGTRTLCADTTGATVFGCAGGGGGGVTSVGLSLGVAGTAPNVTGSPVTGSGSITLNLPDASLTARGLVSTGTQPFAGAKSFNSLLTTSQINPATDNMYTFGTALLRWKEVHVGPSSLYIHNDLIDTNRLVIGFNGSTASIASNAATPLEIKVGTAGLSMSTGGVVTATGSGGINGSAINVGSVAVLNGGTAQTAWAINEVLVGTGTNTVARSAIPSCSNGVTSKLLFNASTQAFTCGTDQTGAGGTGITTLNGLTADPQTFTNDTNVTIVSGGSAHVITWAGTLAVARGGSGAGTLAGLLVGNGTSAFTAVTTSAGVFAAISDETGGGGVLVGNSNPTIVGGSITALTTLSTLNSGTGAFSLRLLANETMTGNKTLTLRTQDGNRVVSYGGDLTTASSFTTIGGNPLTLRTTGSTDVFLPLTGTLATLAGAETLTNKTLTAPVLNVGSDATGDTYTRVAGVLTRVPVGTTGQVYTVAGGVPTWATAGASSYPVATLVSASYTVLTTDWLVSMDATAGARTVTLYTASGNSGKIAHACKRDTSANPVTVSATGSYVLAAPGDCVRLISDGSSWVQQ